MKGKCSHCKVCLAYLNEIQNQNENSIQSTLLKCSPGKFDLVNYPNAMSDREIDSIVFYYPSFPCENF